MPLRIAPSIVAPKRPEKAPKSDFAPDAWLQLGEHFFNNNQLTHAIRAYTAAAETKKPRIFSFALYKLAWCDYNLQEYDGALQKFRDVVADGDFADFVPGRAVPAITGKAPLTSSTTVRITVSFSSSVMA